MHTTRHARSASPSATVPPSTLAPLSLRLLALAALIACAVACACTGALLAAPAQQALAAGPAAQGGGQSVAQLVSGAVADHAVGTQAAAQAVAVQDDDEAAEEEDTTKRFTRSMLTFTDDTPFKASLESVTMKDGDTALTKDTDYTLSVSGSAKSAKVVKVTAYTYSSTYTGSVYVSYTVTDDTESGTADTIRNNLSFSFADSTLTAVLGSAVSGNCTVARDSSANTITITGKDSLAGQKLTVSYTIAEGCTIDSSMMALAPSGSGDEATIAVTLTDEGMGKTLVAGTDYTATVTADTPCEGAYQVYISGTGAYSGTISLYCVVEDGVVVEKQALTSSNVTLDAIVFIANGKEQVPSVTVTDSGTVLAEGTDYAVERPSPSTEAGEYKLTITGLGGYVAKVERTYYIAEEAGFDVSLAVKESPYTAAKQTPSLTVVKDDATLAQYSDYTISYPDDMTSAGTKTIAVRGTGNYSGATLVDYVITPVALDDTTTVSGSGSYNMGDPVEITPSVRHVVGSSTRTLTADTDFEVVSYANNVEIASSEDEDAPTVTVKGIGNFTGTATGTFSITQYSFMYNTSPTVGELPDEAYTGSAITPVPEVTLNGHKLTYETDFTIDYRIGEGDYQWASYTTEPYYQNYTGIVSAYIYGAGNFSDSMYVEQLFKVTARSMDDVTIEAVDDQTYTGSAIEPTPKVTYGDKELTAGTDYSLTYKDNTNPGTATITLTGLGGYTGERTVKFKIPKTGTAPKVTAKRAGSGTVVLSWNPIYKAKRYRVLEKNTDGSYRTLSKSYKYTVCTINNLSPLRKHRFLVMAYVDKKWSSKSDKNLVSIKPTGSIKPKVRAQSASKTSVQLTWSSIPGADRYALYQKVGKTFQRLTDSYQANTVTMTGLKNKTRYTFYVRAHVDSTWSKVKKSDYVTCAPADPNSPVVTAKAGVGKGKVKLSWKATRNATKYMVQAKVAKGKWKTLTKSCKKTTYTAKGLKGGKKYTFRVRAYGNKRWSKLYSDYYATATPDNA